MDLPKINNKNLVQNKVVDNSGAGLKGRPATTASSYTERYVNTSPFRPMTEDEIAAEKKRDRTKTIIAAIGDTVAATANLINTSKGGRSLYKQGDTTMSEANKARYDKLNEAYRANMAKYQEGLWRAQQMDEQIKQERERVKRQAARDKAEDERWILNLRNNIEQAEANRRNSREIAIINADKAARAAAQADARRLAADKQKNTVSVMLSDGSSANVDSRSLSTNIGTLYAKLPKAAQTAVGKPIYQSTYDQLGKEIKQVVGYEQPSDDAMWSVIQQNMTPEISNTILSLSGDKRRVAEKPKGIEVPENLRRPENTGNYKVTASWVK